MDAMLGSSLDDGVPTRSIEAAIVFFCKADEQGIGMAIIE